MHADSLSLKLSEKKIVLSLFQIILSSFFIAISSYVSIPLPFSPVPLSLQTFAVMLVGITFGGTKGALAVLLYLMEGVCELPIFALGNFGLATLLGTNGGYLVGFIFQAYLAGLFIEKVKSTSFTKTFLSFASICALQLTLGMLYLSLFVGLKNAFFMGVFPFLLGEALKVLTLTLYVKGRNFQKAT